MDLIEVVCLLWWLLAGVLLHEWRAGNIGWQDDEEERN